MEFIDDHPVVQHQVRFKNRAEITEHQAQQVRDGMVVMWLVRARAMPPQYHPVARDAEERYRFSIQEVEDVIPLDGDIREAAVVYMDKGADQAYLSFEVPRYSEAGLLDPASAKLRDAADALAEQSALDQLNSIRELLIEAGEIHDDETVAEAIDRILADRLAEPFPEPDDESDEPDESDESDDNNIPLGADYRTVLPDETVERLGSVYVHGSPTQDMLRQVFGDAT